MYYSCLVSWVVVEFTSRSDFFNDSIIIMNSRSLSYYGRPYTSILQFKREIGKYVDQEEVARYLDYVFVPVELNTSSEDDIKALPGIGNKMTHEFLEYRPYKNLAQFRKEIGKYVDEKELNRLERFVYLKE